MASRSGLGLGLGLGLELGLRIGLGALLGLGLVEIHVDEGVYTKAALKVIRNTCHAGRYRWKLELMQVKDGLGTRCAMVSLF